MSDGEDRKKQSPLTWVLGGCGGVLLLGVCLVCIGPSFFGMAMMGLNAGKTGSKAPAKAAAR